MTSWHDEIVSGVKKQFDAAAEAADRERRRSEAVIDFWRRTCDALKLFCNDANGQLGKQIFDALPVSQDRNYVCSITYKGPTERLAGVSLDGDLQDITVTIPNQSEKFTLKPSEGRTAVAVHANEKEFTPNELAEEVIRSITQIDAGLKFQMPARKVRFDEDDVREAREW